MTLGSTQPLKEMTTKNTSWGAEGSSHTGLVHVPTAWKSGRPNLLKPYRPVQACMSACFSF